MKEMNRPNHEARWSDVYSAVRNFPGGCDFEKEKFLKSLGFKEKSRGKYSVEIIFDADIIDSPHMDLLIREVGGKKHNVTIPSLIDQLSQPFNYSQLGHREVPSSSGIQFGIVKRLN